MLKHYSTTLRIISAVTLAAFFATQVAWGHEEKMGTDTSFGVCPHFFNLRPNQPHQASASGVEADIAKALDSSARAAGASAAPAKDVRRGSELKHDLGWADIVRWFETKGKAMPRENDKSRIIFRTDAQGKVYIGMLDAKKKIVLSLGEASANKMGIAILRKDINAKAIVMCFLLGEENDTEKLLNAYWFEGNNLESLNFSNKERRNLGWLDAVKWLRHEKVTPRPNNESYVIRTTDESGKVLIKDSPGPAGDRAKGRLNIGLARKEVIGILERDAVHGTVFKWYEWDNRTGQIGKLIMVHIWLGDNIEALPGEAMPTTAVARAAGEQKGVKHLFVPAGSVTPASAAATGRYSPKHGFKRTKDASPSMKEINRMGEPDVAGVLEAIGAAAHKEAVNANKKVARRGKEARGGRRRIAAARNDRETAKQVVQAALEAGSSIAPETEVADTTTDAAGHEPSAREEAIGKAVGAAEAIQARQFEIAVDLLDINAKEERRRWSTVAGAMGTEEADIIDKDAIIEEAIRDLRQTLAVMMIYEKSGDVVYGVAPMDYGRTLFTYTRLGVGRDVAVYADLSYTGFDVKPLALDKKILIAANSKVEAEAVKAEILKSEGIGLQPDNIKTAGSRQDAEEAVKEAGEFDFVVRVGNILYGLKDLFLPEAFLMDYTQDQFELRDRLEYSVLRSSV